MRLRAAAPLCLFLIAAFVSVSFISLDDSDTVAGPETADCFKVIELLPYVTSSHPFLTDQWSAALSTALRHRRGLEGRDHKPVERDDSSSAGESTEAEGVESIWAA